MADPPDQTDRDPGDAGGRRRGPRGERDGAAGAAVHDGDRGRVLRPAQIRDPAGSPRIRRAAARQCAGRGRDLYCDPPRYDRRHGDRHTAWVGGCRGAGRRGGARRLGGQPANTAHDTRGAPQRGALEPVRRDGSGDTAGCPGARAIPLDARHLMVLAGGRDLSVAIPGLCPLRPRSGRAGRYALSYVVFGWDRVWLAVVQSPACRQAQRALRPVGSTGNRALLDRSVDRQPAAVSGRRTHNPSGISR